MVAPTCDLMSSPTIGSPAFLKRLFQYSSRAMKTGMQLTNAHPVAAQVDVHQTGHGLARIGVAVVADALHERARAVTDADDGHADLVVLVARGAVGGTVGGAHFRVAFLEVPLQLFRGAQFVTLAVRPVT